MIDKIQNIKHILVIEDSQGKRVKLLEAATYSIGRDANNTITLHASKLVSRQHAILLRVTTPGTTNYFFRLIDSDLQGKRSTNGITVNEQRCFSRDLKHGDVIIFGGEVKARYYATASLSDLDFIVSSESTDLSAFLSNLADPFPTLVAPEFELVNSPESALVRLASFPELLFNSIIEITLDGAITYLNPAALAQFPNLLKLKLAHPILAGLISTIQQGKEKFFIREVECETRIFEQSIHYIAESDLIRSYVVDITERKEVEVALRQAHDDLARTNKFLQAEIIKRQQAEESLRESQRRLASLIDALPGIAFSSSNDPSWPMTYLSEGCLKLTGSTSEELIISGGGLYKTITHPEDLPRVLNTISIAISQKQSYVVEYRIRTKSGEEKWLWEKGSGVFDSSGNVLGLEGFITEITDLKLTEAKLLHDALHDTLTGLPNRALFMERLRQALKRTKQQQNYLFAVLFLDLDRFKVVNDSLGHLIGDQLLIAIARRLEACMRPEDTVARLGGDEFTILLDDIQDLEDAKLAADRILQELKLPFKLSGQEVFTSATIGIALGSTNYDRPEDLLRDADTTMYHAKTLGKGQAKVFLPSMHIQAMALLRLETELRQALNRREFQIHYQPIVSLNNGRITSFEALVRWYHPERGLVLPDEFIVLAEETGLIVEISQWVLTEACRQMSAWQARFQLRPPINLSVNVSSQQFSQPELVEQINRILQETGLDPSSLKLEITETALIENAASVAVRLRRLKAMGVQLYLDDFGTGYSSLSYLHELPIDSLKIDRAFIDRIGLEDNKAEIVETIVNLASNLKLGLIAEGIKTAAQVRQLKALGCNYGQGSFFSMPLDSQGIEVLLTALQQSSSSAANLLS